MRKACVDDAVVGNAKDQLVTVDAGGNSAFDEETIVGRIIEREEIDQVPVRIGDTPENALSMPRRNEAVRVVPANERGFRETA